MKKMALGAAVALLFALTSFAAPKTQTFTGEIMDSQCAQMGGHQMMEKKGQTAKDCTLMCVKGGGKFVLYSAADMMTYQLDDQKKFEPFAGDKVKVTGTLDNNGTIHVTSVKKAS